MVSYITQERTSYDTVNHCRHFLREWVEGIWRPSPPLMQTNKKALQPARLHSAKEGGGL